MKFRVKAIINKKGLKQKHIAKETGLTERTIGRIINNQTKQIKLSTMEKLTQVFNCEVGDLFTNGKKH